MQPQPTLNTQIPEQFSSISGFGAPVAVHPVTKSNRWVSAIFAVLLLGVAGLAVLYGIYDAYTQSAKYGPLVFERALLPPLIVAGISGLIAVWLGVNAFLNWNKAVVAYEKGLAYSDNNGVQTWGWHEVDSLNVAITKHYHNGVYTGTTYIYTLLKADRSRLTLDNKLQKIEQLGRLVSQNVAPFQYERLVAAIKSGQTVTLGPVAINKDGLAFGKKTYPWNDIEQVAIKQGYVSIKKRDGGWFSGASAPAAAIPNLDAFLSVVDQIVKIKAG